MCLIEIRSAQGGADAGQFAADLAASMGAWAARRGWPAVPAAPAGRSRTLTISLPGVPAGAAS